jgi:hypothetical protein
MTAINLEQSANESADASFGEISPRHYKFNCASCVRDLTPSLRNALCR